MTTDLLTLDLVAIADAIRNRRVSSLEVTRAAIARAEATQPRLNAFIQIETEAALAAAKAADDALAKGAAIGPLHGVPLAHKDMYYRAGKVTSCGSMIRKGFVAPLTATVIERLASAGAIHMGSLNLAEFASNPTGHNGHWGDCRNPWNPARITGGSSSGSGAAVAAGACYGSLGSDTGGSIRGPAAFCGVTGLKATYGRVSRHGAMPLSHSMDHVGPLARSARDCARLLTVMAGPDGKDATMSQKPVPDYEAGIEAGIKGLRIGVASNYFPELASASVKDAIQAAAAVFAALGASVRAIEVPDPTVLNNFGSTLARTESATIHARWVRERPQDYTPQVREWMQIGLAIPATRYVAALNMRGPLLDDFRKSVFTKVDLLLVPTVPDSALSRAETAFGGRQFDLTGQIPTFMRPFNYLGLPALALPSGFDGAGLPLSMQLVARPFDEAPLLRAGHAYQSATDWHRRQPPL